MSDHHDGSDQVGYGEASLGEAQAANPPLDPEMINEDADDAEFGEPEPEPINGGPDDPAPNAP
jgi:hypothetical protein